MPARERPWSEGRCREEGHRLAQIAIDQLPVRQQRAVPDAPAVIQGRAVFYGDRPGDRVTSTVETTEGAATFREHPAFREPHCRVRIRTDWNGYVFYDVEYTNRHGQRVRKSHIPADAAARRERRGYLASRQAKRRAREQHGFRLCGPETRAVPIRDWARQPIESTQLEPGKTVICHSYRQFEKEVERRNLEIYKIQ